MSKRDWSRNDYIIGGLVFLSMMVCLLLLVRDLTASETKRQMRAEQDAHENADQAQDRIRKDCAGLTTVALVDCATKEVEAADKASHDSYDLTAQQDSAEAAVRMLWASIAGIVATIIGLIVVWLNLVVAREATGEAKAQTVAAERADRKSVV